MLKGRKKLLAMLTRDTPRGRTIASSACAAEHGNRDSISTSKWTRIAFLIVPENLIQLLLAHVPRHVGCGRAAYLTDRL